MVNELLATTEHKTFAAFAEPADETDHDLFSAAHSLCEEYCGQELGAATVRATYQIPAEGTWILLPFRSYPLASILAVGDIVTDALPSRKSITVTASANGEVTVDYTETVPPIIMRAILRQTDIFSERSRNPAPESVAGLDNILEIKLNQNPMYLAGLSNDVRAMLAPYRRLSF